MRQEIALIFTPWLCDDVSRLEQLSHESQGGVDSGGRIESDFGMDLRRLRD